jgi:hypothetical protein
MKAELPQGTLHYEVVKYSGILKKTAGSPETSVITYKTARHYNPEDRYQHYSHEFMCFSFRVCYRAKNHACDKITLRLQTLLNL